METSYATETAVQAEVLLQSVASLLQDGPHTFPGFGVGSGKGGTILFYCHYAAYTGDAQYYDLALAQLEQVLQELNPQSYKSHFGNNYYQELAELGGLLCYLAEQGHLEWDNEPLLSKIDTLLETRMHHFLTGKNLEVVNGALSAGLYFLRRAPHSAKARRCLDTLLDAVQALREGDEARGYYWTCYAIIEPRVYTGLSHGSAMLISFLAAVHETGIRQAECATLLHYATKFLLGAQVDPATFRSSFPLWLGHEELTSNLCLLYGDLGTAYAIAKAAQILDNDAYRREAIRIARRTTTRVALPHTLLHDASVWYGVAGTYLLYDALHRQTDEADFASAAAYWLAQLPTRAKHQNEYLGFSSHFFGVAPEAQLSFNFGVVGIGLTLVQALSQGAYSLDKFIWLA